MVAITSEGRLPPPDRGGPFGLSIPQCVMIVVVTLLEVWLIMISAYKLAAVSLAFMALMGIRICGVHGYQWSRTLIRVTKLFLKGGFTWRSRAHLEGFILDRPKLLEELRVILKGRLQFAEFPLPTGGGLCVVQNRDTKLTTATFTSRGSSFMTQDLPTQLQHNRAFGGLLDKLASGSHPVALYKWTHRTSPSTTADAEAFNRDHVDAPQPGDEEAARNLAAAQVLSITGGTRHDIEQTLGMSPSASSILRGKHRKNGGGLRLMFDLLLPHISSFVTDLVGMDVREVQPLNTQLLDIQLKRAFGGNNHEADQDELVIQMKSEPGTTSRTNELNSGLPSFIHLPRSGRWVNINGKYAQSFYVPGYQKQPVDPHHLASLLVVTGVSRAVTVMARPVTNAKLREFSDTITASVGEGRSDRRADQGVREKVKYMSRGAFLRQREIDLDAGFTDWMWSMYITVWADTLDQLHADVEAVRAKARDSKLSRLHEMWGWQLEGALYTSPALGVS